MGAAPHVNVVLLLSWSRAKADMKTILKVFRKERKGNTSHM